ncbi:Hok/Gef family protein [Erwinia typographi]|uniref:Hok/Gef family protein n=1 Tax=Erwinia typographi TaxID=371042 RepID=UPI000907BABC|nr:Hok/Gef family protein [Erwinia typographi]
MAQKLLFLSLLVVCVTMLIFTWLTRDTLCELIHNLDPGRTGLIKSFIANVL